MNLRALLVLTVLGLSSPARAQTSRADALFEEGRRLAEAGKPAEACVKFEESHELDPAIGTLLNMADCYEKLGRNATAWQRYKTAAALSKGAKDREREDYAKKHAARLERKLPKLTIKPGADSGVQVERDGAVVPEAELGRPVYVDVGSHTVRATAPGHKPFVRTVDVEANTTTVVEVPALEVEPPEPEPDPEAEAPPPPESATAAEPTMFTGRRIAAISAAGAGVVAIGVGSVFGLRARSRWQDAKPHCDAMDRCDMEGVSLVDDAHSDASVATVMYLVGGVGIVTGVVLWLTAPAADEPARPQSQTRIAPLLGGGVIGLDLEGRF